MICHPLDKHRRNEDIRNLLSSPVVQILKIDPLQFFYSSFYTTKYLPAHAEGADNLFPAC